MDYYSSTQTISWFRDRYAEGRLELRPPFQRKPVWVATQKCSLIESILLGFPIPEAYIQVTTTAEGHETYGVVDGQQRIRTILQFIGVERDKDEIEHNLFVLDRLDESSRYINKSIDDLSEKERKDFFGHQLAVRYLKTDNDDQIKEMFRRLNKYLTPLNAQELRNATYSGPFIRLVNDLSDLDYWAENRLVTPAQIRRQKDMVFVSELLIGTLHGPQGGGQAIIDEYYERYEDYDDEFPGQRAARSRFESTLDMIQGLFPNIRQESRWGNMTDFYSLFVVISALLREKRINRKSITKLREPLQKMAAEVDRKLGNESARASANVSTYVTNVQKGANDRLRRAKRHEALLEELEQHLD